MQNQDDFKLCASSTDVVKNFADIKSVFIKRVHCNSLSCILATNLNKFIFVLIKMKRIITCQ